MSDDEEMTDMSQVMTQSGTISGSITQSGSNTLIESDHDNRSWGKIDIYKVATKRLGVRVCISSYPHEKIHTVGKQIQNIHFTTCVQSYFAH